MCFFHFRNKFTENSSSRNVKQPNNTMEPKTSNKNQTTGVYENNVLSTIGEKLFLNEEFADFHFIFKSSDGPSHRIPAHKIFLAAASDVFQVMFNNSWLEKKYVNIVDASVSEFKEFLQFFYLQHVELSMENVEKVLYLGHKYNVNGCLNTCGEFLAQKTMAENICWVYELAILFGPKKLKKSCEIIISYNTQAVLESDSFLNCNRDALNHIINLDFITCTDIQLFESCIAWVKNVSGKKNVTKEIVQAHLGESFSDMFKNFFIQLTDPQPGFFNRRNGVSSNGFKAFYSRTITEIASDCSYYLINAGVTTFSCYEPLHLTVISCEALWMDETDFYRKYFGNNILTEIQIVQILSAMDADDSIILHRQITSLNCEERSEIKLSRPILIVPGFTYEIRFKEIPTTNLNIIAQNHPKPKVYPPIFIRVAYDDNGKIARAFVNGMQANRF